MPKRAGKRRSTRKSSNNVSKILNKVTQFHSNVKILPAFDSGDWDVIKQNITRQKTDFPAMSPLPW